MLLASLCLGIDKHTPDAFIVVAVLDLVGIESTRVAKDAITSRASNQTRRVLVESVANFAPHSVELSFHQFVN